MPSAVYKKAKERIALVLRIKNLNKEAELCSCYRRNSCRCLVDSKESPRYSEYVCSKYSYDSQRPKKIPIVLKQVCRFFISLIRRKAPPPKLDVPCLLAFKLDFAAFSNALDFVRKLPELPLFDLNNPF
jgi:hypothetical protein